MSAMASMSQALLLKHWRLCRLSLLIHQVFVLAIVSLIISVMAEDATVDGHSFAAQAVVLTSLIFLLAPVFSLSTKSGKAQGVGFPYLQEFSLPIPTTLLVLTPLAFFTALMLFAYVVPMLILSSLFDITGPQLTFAIMVVETTLVVVSLSWWTSSSFGHGLGWVIVLFLYWNQFLYPEFVVSEQTSIAQVSGVGAYIESAIVTLILVVTMVIGVRRQRFAENLFGFKQEDLFRWESLSARNLFSRYQDDCPIDSAVAAERWNERQLRGLTQTVPFGLLMGLLALITINLISSNGGWDEGPRLEEVLSIASSFFLMVLLVQQMQVFGISYRNGHLFNTAFNRCRPMGTARLLFIKLSNNTIGLVAGALSIAFVFWFLGSLFIPGFIDIKADALSKLSDFLSAPLPELLRRTFLLGVMGLTAVFLLAAINAWFMLRPKLMGGIFSSLAIYAFILIAVLIRFSDMNDFPEFDSYVRNKHLWILVIALPAALYYLARSVLADRVVNQQQLLIMLVASVIFAAIYIFDLGAIGFYNEAATFEVTLWYSMMGLTPLLAILACLWTLAEIRHG